MQLRLSSPAGAPFRQGEPRLLPRALAKGPCRLRGKGDAGGTRVARRTSSVSSTPTKVPAGLQAKPAGNDIQILERPEEEEARDLDGHRVIPGTELEQPLIDRVKAMLGSMGDGEISVSAYDTAWVALVPRLDGGDGAQFPAALRWILGNQLPDGSWGDAALFSAYDRITNTLACVVALTKWSLGPENCTRGLSFLEDNMWRLAEEDSESMPIGFEIAFPSLLEAARSLDVVFPYDHHALQRIYANREVKLKKIPMEMMHSIPTTILHSLEGMPGVDWRKILRLQSSDGSFLFSPAATASALMQTGDAKCFEYIDRIVKKFDGGVPNVYPVDLFEHIWVVDRLERLGISRYFKQEIKQCLDYVHRHWTEGGICWARNSAVVDVDDTAMAFRLLRLHRYNVSPSVFENFEKDGEFFCFVGQSTQAVTGMYNLNRASQVRFPGEDVLQRAGRFSYEFLRQREARGTIRDKWIISKDLPGEVQYALDFPWYASLPRVEARVYLDQYGGDDDVWIGKTLYRMPLVNNNTYLELAKRDFNRCQIQHQLEWHGLQKWFTENGLEAFGVAPRDVLRAYFLAAACIFEPSRATERLAWARASVMANIISKYLRSDLSGNKMVERFMHGGLYEGNNDISWLKGDAKVEILVGALEKLIDLLAQTALHVGEEPMHINNLLRCVWVEWMMQEINRDDGTNNMSVIETGLCMVHDKQTSLLLVKIIEICAGRIGEASSMVNSKDNTWFIQLASSICDSLHHRMLLSQDTEENKAVTSRMDKKIEVDMQELAQNILQSYDDRASNNMKQTFWSVVKSCYYVANCPSYIFDRHVSKVIFEHVF
ncbi:ent-copalyl diphosphate synthase 1, chloroplastic-like isoform X1 [Triticum dicoccoides]|uniref:ent-copalyl diphosphate synthase 1, chloroplastic-like isoform X1 n=1 Tax=Triticum dicoccoides TaxID=85692 RepID=UPI0018907FFA|nr:ent-copalyl diphosphate synthase 1, chloroplastic-like isoform X1 [Triticum dicoccoides]